MNKGISIFAGFFAAIAIQNVTLAAGESSVPADLQDLKSDILNLNREITQLESELLYPSSSTAILVGINAGSRLRLVDINVSVDDQNVGYHAYSEQETAALGKGGLHRVYMGNVTSGQHVLKAVINAYDARGKDFQRTVTYTFNKGSLRKIVEVKAAEDPSGAQPAVFTFNEWESKN
ncbi:hypothetical protein EV700_2902 [Fluviicoccus keumensis]|uniref:AraC family transcriptional regulator n=1 Tax=Fluviicoccus keumensis TaxID=1435465 RepID=A0A4Q7YKK4_9GAMM|nr:hypothetical protein [Fluviicoccus keumensis]RZU37035.1 hypothetical protein EV700_2902 [Fluviicoccus keumensis]